MSSIPTVVVTGASGFIGRYLVEALKDRFNVFALGRRSPRGFTTHDHVHRRRLDIAVKESVNALAKEINASGGAEFVFHLAGYYDFTNQPHPVTSVGKTTFKNSARQPDLKGMEQRIYDLVQFTIQLLVDEIEDTYDQIKKGRRQDAGN